MSPLADGATLLAVAQDATILRLPQRIAAWFLLSLCDACVNGTSPFLPLLAEVRLKKSCAVAPGAELPVPTSCLCPVQAASHPTASPVEKNFVLQLLLGPLPPEVGDRPRQRSPCCRLWAVDNLAHLRAMGRIGGAT